MDRRQLLKSAGMAAVAAWTGNLADSAGAGDMKPSVSMGTPILDAHIHLFDPTRAGGVPWPMPDDPIYKPAVPARYEALARRLGIVGAIAIEASPLRTDNDWLLRVVRESKFIVGMIGDLPPTADDFGHELDRLHRNPLFLGIRHGNLWNRDLSQDLKDPRVWQNLQYLEACNLVFETANPDLALLKAVLAVAERVPQLRIVVDHMPHMEQPPEVQARRDFAIYLRDLAAAPNVSIKLSEIPQLRDGGPILDIGFYKSHLDLLWDTFGEDCCIFGSDWPNSDHVASLEQTVFMVKDYLSQKSGVARRKFFMDNSRKVYRWEHRYAVG